MGHDAQWAILALSITLDLHVQRSLLSFDLNQNLNVPTKHQILGSDMAKRTAAHFFLQRAKTQKTSIMGFLKRGDIFD